jgi:hypothetical protein
LLIPIKPEAVKPVLAAYFAYCNDPNENTAAAVGEAHPNVDWNTFGKQLKELTENESDES